MSPREADIDRSAAEGLSIAVVSSGGGGSSCTRPANGWAATSTRFRTAGWHNNYHRHPGSARQGFYWWGVDATHYALVVLSWLGVVRDLRGPGERVLEEGRIGHVA